jgi:hypothetical protein
MFSIYVYKNSHVPSSKSLVTSINSKAKYTFHAAAMLLFYVYILQNYYLNKSAYFSKMIYYRT